MRVIESKTQMWQACLASARPLGLVPTMGSLHPGHMALVDRACTECATVAATIFVNPTQFGPNEDLDTYPRSMDRDLSLLEQAGVDLVFTPTSTEVYPRGFNTWVDVLGPAQGTEGLYRPGHFRGVATVVAKLLNITRPDRAYFGQKDGNQTAVIRQLVRDLDMMTEIVVVPTVREESGLAYSSRNAYLDSYQTVSGRCHLPRLDPCRCPLCLRPASRSHHRRRGPRHDQLRAFGQRHRLRKHHRRPVHE